MMPELPVVLDGPGLPADGADTGVEVRHGHATSRFAARRIA